MIVVSDASPLIALQGIDCLDLLPALYQRVAVPERVWQEIEEGATVAHRNELAKAHWIDRRSVGESQMVEELQASLDRGEAEAIALALELHANLLLMDERMGRSAATRLGLHVIGVLGILVEAKHRGLVPLLAPLIARLREEVGFRLAPAVVERVLRDVGEAPPG